MGSGKSMEITTLSKDSLRTDAGRRESLKMTIFNIMVRLETILFKGKGQSYLQMKLSIRADSLGARWKAKESWSFQTVNFSKEKW